MSLSVSKKKGEVILNYISISDLAQTLPFFIREQEQLGSINKELHAALTVKDKNGFRLLYDPPGAATLRRLLGPQKDRSVADSPRNRQLVRILDCYVLYIQKVKNQSVLSDFSAEAVQQIRHGANNYCSNPTHKSLVLTSAADRNSDTGMIDLWKICCIYTNNPESIRYKELLTEQEMYAASNGILLCLNCEKRINTKNGGGITAEELLQWKKAREEVMYETVMRRKRITIRFITDPAQIDVTLRIFRFMSTTDALFKGPEQLTEKEISEASDAVIHFLSGVQNIVRRETVLGVNVSLMLYYCNYFTAHADMDSLKDVYNLWSQARGFIGLSLAELAKTYNVRLTKHLYKIVPQVLLQ